MSPIQLSPTGLLDFFPLNSVDKESDCNAGHLDSIPVSGRFPGEGNGNPLSGYSCLENPMDRGAWQAPVYGVSRVGHDGVTKRAHRFLSFHSSSQEAYIRGYRNKMGDTPLFPGWWSFYFASSVLFLQCLHFCTCYFPGPLPSVRVGGIGEGRVMVVVVF